jgi:hypothetical protein
MSHGSDAWYDGPRATAGIKLFRIRDELRAYLQGHFASPARVVVTGRTAARGRAPSSSSKKSWNSDGA